MYASIFKLLMVLTLVALASTGTAYAPEYKFHVSCVSRNFVVQWNTGDIDPGREYLRAITGTKNPDCGIGDYNAAFHDRLPVERYSDWGGVIQGVPGIGILCGIFGC